MAFYISYNLENMANINTHREIDMSFKREYNNGGYIPQNNDNYPNSNPSKSELLIMLKISIDKNKEIHDSITHVRQSYDEQCQMFITILNALNNEINKMIEHGLHNITPDIFDILNKYNVKNYDIPLYRIKTCPDLISYRSMLSEKYKYYRLIFNEKYDEYIYYIMNRFIQDELNIRKKLHLLCPDLCSNCGQAEVYNDHLDRINLRFTCIKDSLIFDS